MDEVDMADDAENRIDNMDEKELEDLIRILDGFAGSGTSRLKLDVSAEVEDGQILRQYHHGRCDIGSPWACGTAFDVLEE